MRSPITRCFRPKKKNVSIAHPPGVPALCKESTFKKKNPWRLSLYDAWCNKENNTP